MSLEDQNSGGEQEINPSPAPDASPAPDTAQPESPAPETAPVIPHDTTPINPVSDAIDAIKGELRNVVADPSQPPPQRQPRKFDGLDPDEIPLFKQMSNQAYAKLYPSYIANKQRQSKEAELQKQLEEQRKFSLYEADGAWQLSEDYQSLANDRARIAGEAEYWQNQLAAIESGEKWRPLMQAPDGRLYAGEPQDATPQAKALILSNLTKANQYLAGADADLAQYQSQFKTKHQEYVSSLGQIKGQILTPQQEEALKPHIDKTLEKFPSYVRGKPEARLAATLWVLNQGLIKVIQGLRGGQANNVMQQRTSQNAGQRQVSAGTGAGGTVNDAWEEFRKARAGIQYGT